MANAEIIIYQSESNSTKLDVLLEQETVWLTQAQMAELFDTTRNNITLHIGNIFKENELEKFSVSKDSLHTALDGKKYKTKFYNLDVIISVGYRVKSQRGTQFRIWANKIIKEYLLKGYVLNQKIEKIEKKLIEHDRKFELLIKSDYQPKEGIFYEGQIFDAYSFVSKIIKSANKSIVLIDNYVDESVLLMFSKGKKNIEITVYTSNYTKELKLDIKKFNSQYPNITIKQFNKSHDRFLIIDNDTIYHIGASLKDLGKKWFAFSNIKLNASEILNKLEHDSIEVPN